MTAAPTASRRLVVERGPWSAWVHGTRFSVRAVGDGIEVRVREGDVLVRVQTTSIVELETADEVKKVLADSGFPRLYTFLRDRRAQGTKRSTQAHKNGGTESAARPQTAPSARYSATPARIRIEM